MLAPIPSSLTKDPTLSIWDTDLWQVSQRIASVFEDIPTYPVQIGFLAIMMVHQFVPECQVICIGRSQEQVFAPKILEYQQCVVPVVSPSVGLYNLLLDAPVWGDRLAQAFHLFLDQARRNDVHQTYQAVSCFQPEVLCDVKPDMTEPHGEDGLHYLEGATVVVGTDKNYVVRTAVPLYLLVHEVSEDETDRVVTHRFLQLVPVWDISKEMYSVLARTVRAFNKDLLTDDPNRKSGSECRVLDSTWHPLVTRHWFTLFRLMALLTDPVDAMALAPLGMEESLNMLEPAIPYSRLPIAKLRAVFV